MSPPIVKCITKDEREKDGYSSFRQWIEDPKNVYIGNNLHKYAQDCAPSNWINPFHMHYKGEDANKIYESFMRSNGVLLEYLPMLEDKVLGCWCKTGCHGEVIIKLYNEYVTYQGYPFKILDGGGLVPPHWGGTHGGGHDPDGGGFTRDSRHF